MRYPRNPLPHPLGIRRIAQLEPRRRGSHLGRRHGSQSGEATVRTGFRHRQAIDLCSGFDADGMPTNIQLAVVRRSHAAARRPRQRTGNAMARSLPHAGLTDMADTAEPSPDLPAILTDAPKERYFTIAAIARRTAGRLPHPADKFAEPAHISTGTSPRCARRSAEILRLALAHRLRQSHRHHHAPPWNRFCTNVWIWISSIGRPAMRMTRECTAISVIPCVDGP